MDDDGWRKRLAWNKSVWSLCRKSYPATRTKRRYPVRQARSCGHEGLQTPTQKPKHTLSYDQSPRDLFVLFLVSCCCWCVVVESCPTHCDSVNYRMDHVDYLASLPMGFPGRWYWSGLPLPSPGESFRPKGGTCVSCAGRQILYRWATREYFTSFNLETQWNTFRTSGWYLKLLPAPQFNSLKGNDSDAATTKDRREWRKGGIPKSANPAYQEQEWSLLIQEVDGPLLPI